MDRRELVCVASVAARRGCQIPLELELQVIDSGFLQEGYAFFNLWAIFLAP